MKYYKINDLCDEINKDKFELIQASYSKKIFTDNLYEAIKNTYKIDIFLTDDARNTKNELISFEELEHQRNRRNDDRNYIERAIMFSINRYFEEVLTVFINLIFEMNLEKNKEAYNYNNRTTAPDLVENDYCYDIQGRMFSLNNKINNIYIKKHKIENNYIDYMRKYKKYFAIYYAIQGTTILNIQIINISDMIENKKYIDTNENNNVQYTDKINFRTFNIENKEIREIEKMNDTNRYKQIEEKRNYCLYEVSMLDILEYYNIEITKNNMFNCPFHNDDKPSAKFYENTNKMYCYAEALLKNTIDVAEVLSGISAENNFEELLDKIIEISNNTSSFSTHNTKHTVKMNKDRKDAEKDYEKWKLYAKTIEELITEDEERKRNGTFCYTNQLINIAKIYFEERCIDYEKCKKILDLNNYKILFNYYQFNNNFYFDYGYDEEGNPLLIQRNINDIINKSNKFKIKLNEPSMKKFNHGISSYKIIKTTDSSLYYYRDELGKRHMKKLLIVEGIIDALSIISMSSHIEDYTILVLNSTSNINKIFYKNSNNEYKLKDKFEGFNDFILALDQDAAGQKATESFKEKYIKITDDDDLEFYKEFDCKLGNEIYNDVNDFWIAYNKKYKLGA